MASSEENIEKLLSRRRKRVVQNPVAGMSAAIGFVLLLVLAIILLGGSTGTASRADGASAPAASEGQQLYILNCAPCHAQDGSGYAAIQAPAVNQEGEAWNWSQDALEQHILEGGGNMPALASRLDADQVAMIIAYIQGWWTDEQLEAFRANP